MISIFNRNYAGPNYAAPILRQISKHEVEENCEVCQQEETKSPTLKISGTKILERVILPSNECWICDLKFEDAESQVDHFVENHECDFCDKQNFQEKRKHVLVEHECQLCRKYLKNRFGHILDDHGFHACTHCEKYFQTESEVVDHTSSDHFKCRFCDWIDFNSFQETRKHVLDKHACPNCGKYFEYDFQKERHIKEEHPNSDI